jgi:sporulation protein YtfJ
LANDHPIGVLMQTAMESLKSMIDVNTILGDPVETPDGMVILPVSRVSFGFAAGGSEYETGNQQEGSFPFGGGSGGGMSLSPVAFLVVGQGQVRLLPVDGTAIYDRLIDLAPQVIDRIQTLVRDGKTDMPRTYAGIRGNIRDT